MTADTAQPGSRVAPVLVVVGTLLSSTGFFLVLPVLSLYVIEVAGTRNLALAGVALGVSFLVSGLVSPLWGSLTDRFGARPMMLRSAFGLAVAYALFPLAQTVALVIVVRVLNGLVAGYTPAALTMVARVTPKERLGRAMTGMSVARHAGALVGPALGGVLVAYAGFTTAFLVASVVALAAGVVVLPLKEERTEEGPREKKSWVPRLGEGYVALGLTVVTVAATSMLTVTLPLLLGLADADPRAVARNFGVLQSLAGLLALVLAMGWGWLADRCGFARLVPVVFVGSGVLLCVLGMMGSVPTVATVYLVYAAVQCEVMTLVVLYLVAVVPEGVRGAAMGLQNSAQQLGNAIGPVFGGAAAMVVGVRASLGVSGLLLVICCLGFSAARRWGHARRGTSVARMT